jgi:hypothetical protein
MARMGLERGNLIKVKGNLWFRRWDSQKIRSLLKTSAAVPTDARMERMSGSALLYY